MNPFKRHHVEFKPFTKKVNEVLTEQYNELKSEVSYNRKSIFARARYLYNNTVCTWSEALKQSWSEAKKVILRKREELNQLLNKMNSLFTPKQYNETDEYNRIQLVNDMNKAYERNNKFYR